MVFMYLQIIIVHHNFSFIYSTIFVRIILGKNACSYSFTNKYWFIVAYFCLKSYGNKSDARSCSVKSNDEFFDSISCFYNNNFYTIYLWNGS